MTQVSGRVFVRSWSFAHQPPSGMSTMPSELFAEQAQVFDLKPDQMRSGDGLRQSAASGAVPRFYRLCAPLTQFCGTEGDRGQANQRITLCRGQPASHLSRHLLTRRVTDGLRVRLLLWRRRGNGWQGWLVDIGIGGFRGNGDAHHDDLMVAGCEGCRVVDPPWAGLIPLM